MTRQGIPSQCRFLYCSKAPRESSGNGRALYQSTDRVRHEGSGDEFVAYLVGCIFYFDQFGEGHYTAFWYQLKQPE